MTHYEPAREDTVILIHSILPFPLLEIQHQQTTVVDEAAKTIQQFFSHYNVESKKSRMK